MQQILHAMTSSRKHTKQITGFTMVTKKIFADVMSRSFMEKEAQRENLLEAEDSVEEGDSLKEIGLIPYGNVWH